MFTGRIFKQEHEKHHEQYNLNTKNEIDNLRKDFELFKETISELSRYNKGLTEKLSSSQMESNKLRSSRDENNERLNLSLVEMQKLRNSNQETNEIFQNEIKKLNTDLNLLIAGVEQLKSSYNEVNKNLNNSLIEIQTLTNKYQYTDEKLKNTQVEVEKLKISNQELAQKFESSVSEFENFRNNCEKDESVDENNLPLMVLESKFEILSVDQDIKIVEPEPESLIKIDINTGSSEKRFFESPLPSPSLKPENLTSTYQSETENHVDDTLTQPHYLRAKNTNFKRSQTVVIPSETEKLVMEEFERNVPNLISDGSWDGTELYEDDWGNEIAERFPLMRDLKYIGLIGCGFESLPLSDLRLLAVSLRYNMVLQLIDLGYKNIGDVGTKIIANALQDNHTLQVLYLYNNNIKNEGAIAIASMLNYNNSLQFIHLGNNNIEDIGIIALTSSLRSNENLQILDVENNKYGREGFEAITVARHENPNILIQN
ncbi:hypothetical protein HK096_009931, partial [Nowakowskiella sp. JEL0078]